MRNPLEAQIPKHTPAAVRELAANNIPAGRVSEQSWDGRSLTGLYTRPYSRTTYFLDYAQELTPGTYTELLRELGLGDPATPAASGPG